MKRILSAALVAAFALLLSFAPQGAYAQQAQGGEGVAACSQIFTGFASKCFPTHGDKQFTYDSGATKTLTQFIAAPTAGAVHITFASIYGVESATGGTLELETGTGSNCASNTTILYAVALGASGLVQATLGNGVGTVLLAPAKTAVCFFVSAGTLVDGGAFGTYAVY